MNVRIHLALICLALLPGCVSSKPGAVWWNPTTWASRAAPAAVDRASEKRDEAATKVQAAADVTVHAAHGEVTKALEALQSAPDSRPVQLARRFTGNAESLLNQTAPLTVGESTELRQLVADLLSENDKVRAAAEKVATFQEEANAKLSADLGRARAELDRREAALSKSNANLREAYDRENALANQVRNFWFVVGLLAFLWLAGNVLAVGARFVPALAPVSTAINGIAAPALAFAETRARDGLAKVGHAMASVRAKLPEVAEQLTDIFDRHADEDHKRTIGAAANNAPRT